MAFYLSSSPVGSAHSYRGGFLKYWSIGHFYQPIPSYHFGLNFLSPKEVEMKEDIHAWYQGLEYEEGFIPSEVLSFQQKKRLIDSVRPQF